jgi:hypothetical protein
MAIIGENQEAWRNYSVRVPPELAREIERYAEDTGEAVISNSLRSLVAAGLEQKKRGDIHTERVLIANAKGAALQRLDTLLQAVVETFLETPLEGLPDDGDEEDEEDDEEVDDEDPLDEFDEGGDEAPPKRGRGRPKKGV